MIPEHSVNSGFTSQKKIQSPPDEHPERGGGGEHHGEDRDDRGVEQKSTQDGGEGSGKEHGKRRSPELPGVGDDFRLKKPKEGGKQEPRDRQRKERGGHAPNE